ncbi:MAG: hypothetical protein KBD50_00320 [Candidatus Pacebacteria bacterium]|nr:hypothetical protein [Candidatus Paceibacterota bacterium]
MMFFTAFSNSVLIKNVGAVVTALALIAGAYTVSLPAASAEVNPTAGAMCSFLGGILTEDGCQIAGTAICILLETHSAESVEAALNLFGMTVDDFDCAEEETTPQDHCSTVAGVQTEEDTCPSQAELDCTTRGGTWNSETAVCTPANNDEGEGNGDGEGSGGSDTSGTTTQGGGLTGGGSMGGGGGSGGQVLGASTDDVCSTPLITSYLRFGQKNDFVQMVLLQVFLRNELGSKLLITGEFDADTKAAVDQFQVKYSGEVLAPWVPFGLESTSTPTSYVYKTTKRMINKIHCAALDIPMPQLP